MDRKEPLVRQNRFSGIKHARVGALRSGADCMGKRARITVRHVVNLRNP